MRAKLVTADDLLADSEPTRQISVAELSSRGWLEA
jgi:hypothetical protein